MFYNKYLAQYLQLTHFDYLVYYVSVFLIDFCAFCLS